MMSSKYCFDTAFDDVFQTEEAARLFYDERVISTKDLCIRFGLSLVTGMAVSAPAQWLLDSGPFRKLLFIPDWQELIFKQGLLRPGIEADSWDECIRYLAGGTTEERPIYWTTSSKVSQKILEAWQTEGPDAAFEVFKGSLEEIVSAVDIFKKFAPAESKMVIRLGRPPDYRDSINDVLNNLSTKITKSPEWESVRTEVTCANDRSDVYRTIDNLISQGTSNKEILDELRRASIIAKHLQVKSWVRANMVSYIPPKGVPERFILDGMRAVKVFKRKGLWEVPLVGKLLDGDLDARALLTLANNTYFVSLRQDLLKAKHNEDTNGQVNIIRKLCYLAGDILGTPQKDGVIHHIEGLGGGMFISGIYQLFTPVAQTNPVLFLLGLSSAIMGPFLMLAPTAWKGVRRNLISQHIEKAAELIM